MKVRDLVIDGALSIGYYTILGVVGLLAVIEKILVSSQHSQNSHRRH